MAKKNKNQSVQNESTDEVLETTPVETSAPNAESKAGEKKKKKENKEARNTNYKGKEKGWTPGHCPEVQEVDKKKSFLM